MEERMTIDQVLGVTIDILEGIDVPMKKLEAIGVPIQQAISNIRLCIQAVEDSRKPKEEPGLSVVPCDEPDTDECEEMEIGAAN